MWNKRYVTPTIVNLKDDNKINWSVDLPNGTGYKVTTLPSEYSVKVTHNGSEITADNPHVVSEVGEYVFTLYCNGIKHDYEPVTVVNVTNPYLLDIDPDNDWVQTKEDGTPLTPYSKTINCRFWDGDKEVMPTYTANPTGCSVEPTGTSGSYTVKYNGNEKESATVVFNATYNGTTTSKTFTLHKSLGKPTYRIIVPAQLNNTTGAEFNVTVEKIDGNDTTVYTSPQDGLVLYFKGNQINNWTNISVSSTENATELYLELQDADGVFLDGEYITLVKNGALDESQIANINKAIDDAKKAVLADADAKITTARVDFNANLEKAEQDLQQAISDGDAIATQKALEAVQTAETLSEALDSLERSHDALSNTVDGVKNSVLNETQVKNLSIAALTEETSITNNTISSKTVIGQQIIGLAGTFAKVQAENIEGSVISGIDFQSNKTAYFSTACGGSYSQRPLWKITNDGSGYFAKGNICWDENGNVSFGSGVNITWNSEWDDKIPDVSGYMTWLEVNDAIADETANFVTSEQVDSAISDKTGNFATKDEIVSIDTINQNIVDKLSELDGNEIVTRINDNSVTSAWINGKWINADTITANTINASSIKIGDIDITKLKNYDQITARSVVSSNGFWHLDDGGFYYQDLSGSSSFKGTVYISTYGAEFSSAKDTDLSSTTSIRYDGVTISYEDNYVNIYPGSITVANENAGITKISSKEITIYDGNITLDGRNGKINAPNGFFQTSDERLKTFHDDVEIDFEKLKSIPKKYFTWKDGDSKLQLGTSAQKVQALYPELVNDGDELSVDYARLSVVGLAAIDKLYEELIAVKNELTKVKAELKTLKGE